MKKHVLSFSGKPCFLYQSYRLSKQLSVKVYATLPVLPARTALGYSLSQLPDAFRTAKPPNVLLQIS